MSCRVLVTGGAGFVGCSLALACKRDYSAWTVTAFDNLKRRGSELALARLKLGGVHFQHGDVRSAEDLEDVGPVDLLIDCSAEPSVNAGHNDRPQYAIATNLGGTVNCLEHLRRTGGNMVFLSTSRVYSIGQLRTLPLERHQDRFALIANRTGPGWSEAGVNECFSLVGNRSLYGATKLASELLIEEYRAMYGLRAVINRCGVVTGPWQMGKVDQGFVVLWLARHLFGDNLAYMGFEGEGLQVRDVLHVEDLYQLVKLQVQDIERHAVSSYNVGGGNGSSISLRELTHCCRNLTGRTVQIEQVRQTKPHDIPYYVSDCQAVQATTNWRPRYSLSAILEDVHRWLVDSRHLVEPILAI